MRWAIAFTVASVVSLAIFTIAIVSRDSDSAPLAVEATPTAATTPTPAVPTATPFPRGDGLFADNVNIIPPPVDTSGWKTYDSVKFGYSFDYPPDWILDEHDNWDADLGSPYQNVQIQNPPSDWAPELGYPIAPKFLSFTVDIAPIRCNRAVPRLVDNEPYRLSGVVGTRCVYRDAANVGTGSAQIYFAYTFQRRPDEPLFLVVSLQKGGKVTPAEQAILNAILASVQLDPAFVR